MAKTATPVAIPAMTPWQRLRERGSGSLDDLELFEVLLGDPDRPESRVPVAELWDRFGGLKALLATPGETLRRFPGLPVPARDRLLALREVRDRLWRPDEGPMRGEVASSAAAHAHVAALAAEPQEIVAGLFLDCRNRRVALREVFRGGLDLAQARPREILAEALRANAARLIVAHNHPSGDPEPSAADFAFTEALVRAAEAVGVPLVDHLIVGGEGRYYSFADAGHLRAEARPP